MKDARPEQGSTPVKGNDSEAEIELTLSATEWKHVAPILRWLRTNVDVALPALPTSAPTQFAMTAQLADAFELQLRVFHALHGFHEALSKKSFEYALEAAANDAAFQATIDENATTPGADIVINNEGFSIKTEAGRRISRETVFLTKLMESAWTKHLTSPDQFIAGIQTHVLPRVLLPDRTLVWRCHGRLCDGSGSADYELLEVPRSFWAAMGTVQAGDFSRLTPAGSTSVPVRIEGRTIYTLCFDGSDQKIQIRNLAVEDCLFLGRWSLHRPAD